MHNCSRCGGLLERQGDMLVCRYCQSQYDLPTAERHTATLREMFDEAKQEIVHNRRRVLYDAVTARHISRRAVVRACEDLRTYLPDDFAANFFRAASDDDLHTVNEAINAVDTDENYDEVGLVVEFLVRSMTADGDYLLALNNLVERAYKAQDLELFAKYATMVSEQAERVFDGVYETGIPRDVFVAYSSKDMDKVFALVEALEEQGVSCFVAARNLKHGVGSVENYNAALEEAMDNCTIFLFVSSMRSRNMSCDAVKVEMKYIRARDTANAPAEYRQRRYETIPAAYKKHRIEYRIEESSRPNIADTAVDQFFDGYERVYNPEGLFARVTAILMEPDPTPDPAIEEARRRAEEEERQRQEAEAERQRQEAERRRAEEAERQRQAAEAERQRQAEEARRRAEAERQRQAEEARRRAEAERQRQAEERRRAEEEARRRAEEEAGLRQCKVGTTVKFGSYEQNPGKGKEPIEWIVLANEGKRALLISKYILDCQQYHTSHAAITWENCSLRKWLNSKFLNAAFNATERGRILASRIKNPKNAKYNTNGGNDTTDHVFCLSIDEANQYFATEAARATEAIKAIKAKGKIAVSDGSFGSIKGNSWWWLRSPGRNSSFAANVINNGGVSFIGSTTNFDDYGVRPAMWIDISESSSTPAPTTPPLAPKPAPFSVPAVGGTFKFGSYEQNPGKGKEPIEWIVLANEGKRALLISKYILDCQPYHPQLTAITWENCSLRKWLNSTFLNAAFNATERGRILASRIKNPNNAEWNNTPGGNDTTDHIFCLSIDEANQYFATDEARAAKATPAIKAKGKIWVVGCNGNSYWWLRSPGNFTNYAAYVYHKGDVLSDGFEVSFEHTGHRPAFWINLES